MIDNFSEATDCDNKECNLKIIYKKGVLEDHWGYKINGICRQICINIYENKIDEVLCLFTFALKKIILITSIR